MTHLSANELNLIIGVTIMLIGMIAIIASNPSKYIVGITEKKVERAMTEEEAIKWQMSYDIHNKAK